MEPAQRFIGPLGGYAPGEGYMIEALVQRVSERPATGPVLDKYGPDGWEGWERVDEARVRWGDDPCWAQGVREADGGFRISIEGLERCSSVSEAQRALRGALWLREMEERADSLNESEFLRRVEVAADKLPRWRKLTVRVLLQPLGYGRSQFYEYMRRFGWDWAKLKEHLEIRRLAAERANKIGH